METAKKEKKIKVSKPQGEQKAKVELVSYSIKMTIPTAQFANIIPEIVVKAGTVEEAHDFIAPHMNKLWKEYDMISERPATVTKVAPAPVAPVEVPVAPDTAVAFQKASQAVASCLSQDALDLIAAQIKKSVKLDDKEKDKLYVLVINKQKELNVPKQ
jgi:hypothetical protein